MLSVAWQNQGLYQISQDSCNPNSIRSGYQAGFSNYSLVGWELIEKCCFPAPWLRLAGIVQSLSRLLPTNNRYWQDYLKKMPHSKDLFVLDRFLFVAAL